MSCHLRGICFDYIVLDCTIWLIAVLKNLLLHVLLKICFNFDNFDNKNAIGLVITRTFINSFEPKNIFSQRSTIPLKADHGSSLPGRVDRPVFSRPLLPRP